jgi:5'/3'-nucleotidase SurE
MQPIVLSLGLLSFISSTPKILLTNDDGWAEVNIRALYQSLTAAGNSVVISAPAVDKSGTGNIAFIFSQKT